ncbi:MAG: hypothetical protein KJ578_12220 [Bacteroidetes bacterium]|nr:hypothetical protein [Bacteroidota bacterium]
MLEQELKNIWTSSAQTAQISIETSQLIKELNAKMDGIQKAIRIRDIREISASVIGMLLYMYLLFEIPFPMTRFASALSIVWFAFVILKLRKSKTRHITCKLDLSVRGQLADQEAAMRYQAALLDSVAYWYAIPPFIINCIFVLGLGNPAEYNWTNSLAESILPLSMNLKIGTITGLAFFYALIIWLNKRAASRDIKPILEKINIIQDEWEADNESNG